MENNNSKERKPKGDTAKAVSGWARAVEYAAKALVAVVNLVGLILWEFGRKK